MVPMRGGKTAGTMNRRLHLCNLLLHMQQKVVVAGSWSRCAISKPWGAFHEPQKVAQASCLFGADRLEACPTLQPAARFMAATHVLFWEVFAFAFHEPRTVRRLWAE